MVQAAPWLRKLRFGWLNQNALDEARYAPCESDAFATWLLNKEESGWPSARPMTSIQLAAQKGRAGLVKRLVDAKANVQGDSKRPGWSAVPALYFAVHAGSLGYYSVHGTYIGRWYKGREKQTIAVIAVLLRAKAMLRRPETLDESHYAETPLYEAVSTCQFHVTRFLIRAKADVNEGSYGGAKPLERALANGNEAIVELLRNAGAQ
jgi:hypothetical protein